LQVKDYLKNKKQLENVFCGKFKLFLISVGQIFRHERRKPKAAHPPQDKFELRFGGRGNL